MKVINKKTGENISELFTQLMKKEITNKEFEEITNLEPKENNPSRQSWEQTNK